MITADSTGDMRQQAWSKEDLDTVERLVEEFKRVLVETSRERSELDRYARK